MPVAEEAALTAEVHWATEVVRLYDVGVAGLHRLLAHLDELMSASVIIAIAGMEGALASVIGGLADCPVIAVPTSVGYGASFGGVSALLSMLNSCASGVSVVNIDNGFGAGYLASMINHMGGRRNENTLSGLRHGRGRRYADGRAAGAAARQGDLFGENARLSACPGLEISAEPVRQMRHHRHAYARCLIHGEEEGHPHEHAAEAHAHSPRHDAPEARPCARPCASAPP